MNEGERERVIFCKGDDLCSANETSLEEREL